MNIYVRNLCALWRTDPRLAMAIEAVHPDDLPALEPAKDGAFTVQITGNYLHSRYRPITEASAWAAAQKTDERYAVVVAGFGLGHHIKALFERLPDDALLVVAEPNIALLKVAMGAVDMENLLASHRVMIFTAMDRSQVIERLEPRSVLFTAGQGTLLLSHPASVQADPTFHAAFQKLISEFIAYTRTGFITLMLNNVVTCRNIANNLGRYVTTPPLELLHDRFKNSPAILVAAGPSLSKNMHLLKTLPPHGDPVRPVVICVQTMLKPLLAAGIEPDFVTSLDYNTVSTRFFENLEESGGTGHVHLVAQPAVNWNVLDVFNGSMSLTHHDFAGKLLQDAFPPRAGLKAGATVAHLSFYLAEFLGCDPIILIGQDLGFVDGLYYKPGTAIHETWSVELGRFNTLETKEWERIVRSRTILRTIPDIHGHPMYTEEQFFVYLQQFERDFAASRSRVIDATEGGARKQGVKIMRLQEAMDAFCKPAGPSENRKLDEPWKHWTCDVAANLVRAQEALRSRRDSVLAMQSACEQTIPLLNRMLEHQGDDEKMNRLFVDVDCIRGKVGADPVTLEIVGQLNTIGELRRHHADLMARAARKAAGGGLEHQKRQLHRDIDYVTDLQTGCQRLLEIIDDAALRLEKQLAATANHQPWPREVAGAK